MKGARVHVPSTHLRQRLLDSEETALSVVRQVAARGEVDHGRYADNEDLVGENGRLAFRPSRPRGHEAEAGLHHEHEDQADHGPGQGDTPPHSLEQLEDLVSAVGLLQDKLELLESQRHFLIVFVDVITHVSAFYIHIN